MTLTCPAKCADCGHEAELTGEAENILGLMVDAAADGRDVIRYRCGECEAAP